MCRVGGYKGKIVIAKIIVRIKVPTITQYFRIIITTCHLQQLLTTITHIGQIHFFSGRKNLSNIENRATCGMLLLLFTYLLGATVTVPRDSLRQKQYQNHNLLPEKIKKKYIEPTIRSLVSTYYYHPHLNILLCYFLKCYIHHTVVILFEMLYSFDAGICMNK